MSTRILKLLAAVLLFGALILIAIALRLGQAPQPPDTGAPVAQPQVPQHPILTAVRRITPGETVGAADVSVTLVTTPPPDALTDPAAAVGRRPATAIAAGAPVLHGHFPIENALAQALRPGERAIALKVDELIGVGGFLQPGDHVDVIAYFRGDDQTIKKEQAVIVLHGVRILAYGDDLPAVPGTAGRAAAAPTAKAGKSRGTAVIAVDETGAMRLAVADNAGKLRLALQRPGAGPQSPGQPRAVSLDELAALAVKVPVSAKPKGRVVEVYRGAKLTPVELP